jgi:hypothetical protein
MEALAIFPNPFTVCSSCKREFVVCPFVDKETNRSYLFANGLNGLNGLAHLCVKVDKSITYPHKLLLAQKIIPAGVHFPATIKHKYIQYFHHPFLLRINPRGKPLTGKPVWRGPLGCRLA